MDINEIARQYTRQEFLKQTVKDESCPSDFGLNNDKCSEFAECNDCIKNMAKDIKFKGEEDEIIEDSKDINKYTFREIIANIKESEKFTDGITNISMNDGRIRIEDFHGNSEASYTYGEDYREFIKIKESKQVTICKVNYTANSDKLKEFVLDSNDKIIEGEIVECDANIGNSGWQYARIKEIEIKDLTKDEFVKYKICRKLSN